jgi:hypothetical protein
MRTPKIVGASQEIPTISDADRARDLDRFSDGANGGKRQPFGLLRQAWWSRMT